MLDALFVLICILLLYLSFLLGFFIRTILERIKKAESMIATIAKNAVQIPRDNKQEKKSLFIDPDDPVQLMRYEHEQTLRRLNPIDEDEEEDQ